MTFASLLAELDEFAVPADSAGLTQTLRSLDRLTAKVTLSVHDFEVSKQWDIEGSTSAIAWLQERGLNSAAASEYVQLGRKLAQLPATAAAWIRGELSIGQVRAIHALVIERHLALFAEHESELVPSLSGLSVNDTRFAMTAWRAMADALSDTPPEEQRRRELRHSPTLDNRWQMNGSFDPEGGAVIDAALKLADTDETDVAAPQRRGDALVAICRHFLDHQQGVSGRRNRPHLNIIVKAETLGTPFLDAALAESGMRLDPATVGKLLCDCAMHRTVVGADGAILDYGREVRTPPIDLYNAVVVRDRHCRYYQCDRSPMWCEAHHVKEWEADNGPTSLDNLVLLCEHHHHLIHRRGWAVALQRDGRFEVTTPWGHTLVSLPASATTVPMPIDTHDFDGPRAYFDHAFEIETNLIMRERLRQLERDRRHREHAVALTN